MNEQKQEGALAEGARRANGAKAPGSQGGVGSPASASPASFAGREPGDALPRVGHDSGSAFGARRRGGEAALNERDEENARLKAKVGVTMEGEVLRPPGGRPPFSPGGGGDESGLHLHGQSLRPGGCAPFGAWRAPRAQRGERRSPFWTPNKRGPVGPCTDAELLGHIPGGLPWRGLPQGVGEAASRASAPAGWAMREAGLQAPPGWANPEVPHRAARPNVGHHRSISLC